MPDETVIDDPAPTAPAVTDADRIAALELKLDAMLSEIRRHVGGFVLVDPNAD